MSGRQALQLGGDSGQRQHPIGAARLHQFARHAPDHRGFLGFSDRSAAWACRSAIACAPSSPMPVISTPISWAAATRHGAAHQAVGARMPGIVAVGGTPPRQPVAAGRSDIGIAAPDIDMPGRKSGAACTSVTVRAHSPSSRRASGPVKPAGMCWATTIGQGKRPAAGSAALPAPAARRWMCPPAPGPRPVLRGRRRFGRLRRNVAADPWRTRSRRRRLARSRAGGGADVVDQLRRSAHRSSEIAPRGFGDEIHGAEAQRFQGRIGTPAAVREETMTTGQGCSIMIRSRHRARPFAACGCPA